MGDPAAVEYPMDGSGAVPVPQNALVGSPGTSPQGEFPDREPGFGGGVRYRSFSDDGREEGYKRRRLSDGRPLEP